MLSLKGADYSLLCGAVVIIADTCSVMHSSLIGRSRLPTPLRVCAVWISGIVQTIIYCDFFYFYIKSWRNNEKLALPA